ncbi:MAG: hypothetical protein ACQEST_04480 [Bacteroidota bacterium]
MKKMPTFILVLLITLIPALICAQTEKQKPTIAKVGLGQTLQPSFEINNRTFSNNTSTTFKLLFYRPDIANIELGMFIATGRNQTIDYFYGISPAYFLYKGKSHWFKTGIELGRFKLSEYQRNVALGATLEDEYHESYQPYVEWDWQISQFFSLITKTGYRFISHNTRTVTEIIDRWDDGSIRAYRSSEETHFQGSGFEFSVGINLTIY